MNYLAHGRDVEDPYLLAGTALPDWIRLPGRRLRIRPRRLRATADPASRPLAAGVRRHFEDDAWFHRSPAFLAASARLTLLFREAYPEAARLRAGFLGHVLCEMLLDGWLARTRPALPSRYYAALESVNPERVEAAAAAWTGRDVCGLARVIRRFRKERFLLDYGTDEGVAHRLGQVGRRVGLPALPAGWTRLLPRARSVVEPRAPALLSPA